jgi:acetylglutamate kinase
MDNLYIIKIGGNIINDADKLKEFLASFAEVEGKKILVHGGGKLATELAQKLALPQQLINGRRVTDAETLVVVTMVYAGYINKNIVALLQSHGINAIGLSGADANLLTANRRQAGEHDYGYVGDVYEVNHFMFAALLHQGLTPVIAPITHNRKGQLLNTNADTMAREIAAALSEQFKTTLVFCFEKEGVLSDLKDENSLIPGISADNFDALVDSGVIADGMIPKLENAIAAIAAGVTRVTIGKAEKLHSLIAGTAGTSIT